MSGGGEAMGMEMMGNLNQQAKMAKMQQAWDMKKSGTLPIMGKTGTSIFKTLAPEKKKTSDAEVKKRISMPLTIMAFMISSKFNF